MGNKCKGVKKTIYFVLFVILMHFVFEKKKYHNAFVLLDRREPR